MKKWKGMEESRSKENRTLHAWMRWHAQHPWAMRCKVCIMTTRTWLTNKRTAHSRVSVHVRCVEGDLGLGGHVVIGVVLGFTAQTQYHVQISFLLDFVVHFCTCSQTVFCDRQFLSVANYCTLLHRENGSFEVLSSQIQAHLFLNKWLGTPLQFPGVGKFWVICWVTLILSLHSLHQFPGAGRRTLRGVLLLLLLLLRLSNTLTYTLRCGTRRQESSK